MEFTDQRCESGAEQLLGPLVTGTRARTCSQQAQGTELAEPDKCTLAGVLHLSPDKNNQRTGMEN